MSNETLSQAVGGLIAEALRQAREEIDRLRGENAALRQQVAGHCERIAAASEIIARNAERSPTDRLEA